MPKGPKADAKNLILVKMLKLKKNNGGKSNFSTRQISANYSQD